MKKLDRGGLVCAVAMVAAALALGTFTSVWADYPSHDESLMDPYEVDPIVTENEWATMTPSENMMEVDEDGNVHILLAKSFSTVPGTVDTTYYLMSEDRCQSWTWAWSLFNSYHVALAVDQDGLPWVAKSAYQTQAPTSESVWIADFDGIDTWTYTLVDGYYGPWNQFPHKSMAVDQDNYAWVAYQVDHEGANPHGDIRNDIINDPYPYPPDTIIASTTPGRYTHPSYVNVPETYFCFDAQRCIFLEGDTLWSGRQWGANSWEFDTLATGDITFPCLRKVHSCQAELPRTPAQACWVRNDSIWATGVGVWEEGWWYPEWQPVEYVADGSWAVCTHQSGIRIIVYQDDGDIWWTYDEGYTGWSDPINISNTASVESFHPQAVCDYRWLYVMWLEGDESPWDVEIAALYIGLLTQNWPWE